MGKSETKAVIEGYAKQSGKPAEEIVAEIAALFGYQKTGIPIPPTSEKMSPIMEAIVAASRRGEKLDTKDMFESMMTLKMMEMMGAKPVDSGQNINEILAKNDEKWERRLAEIEAKAEKEALQRRLDGLERLLIEGGGKKNDAVMEEMKGIRVELAKEKDGRIQDALAAKDAQIADLKEYMEASFEELRKPPKTSDEGFFEIMDKMNRFDELVRRRGKSLGMTDEQIDKEVAKAVPIKQQILKDVFKTINRGIDAWSGKQTEDTENEEPEVAEEEPQPQMEKTARKRSEIPTVEEQPAPATVEEQEQTLNLG